jgi:hypothetical protein
MESDNFLANSLQRFLTVSTHIVGASPTFENFLRLVGSIIAFLDRGTTVGTGFQLHPTRSFTQKDKAAVLLDKAFERLPF